MRIRVLLAEDQPIVRAGFRALLDAEADLEVAGEAADGREAVALARELRPRPRPDGHPHAPSSTASKRPDRSPPTPR